MKARMKKRKQKLRKAQNNLNNDNYENINEIKDQDNDLQNEEIKKNENPFNFVIKYEEEEEKTNK